MGYHAGWPCRRGYPPNLDGAFPDFHADAPSYGGCGGQPHGDAVHGLLGRPHLVPCTLRDQYPGFSDRRHRDRSRGSGGWRR